MRSVSDQCCIYYNGRNYTLIADFAGAGSFSEPEALKTQNALSNITLKMYDVDKSGEGFHTKGYIFRKAEIYRIIIGSSNITKTALTTNREWNTRIVSTSQGEMSKSVVDEFYELWNSKYALDFDEFYENYKK